MLKHFAFYYNDKCPVHKKAKYSASYWLQESKSEQLRGIKEEDKLWELKQNPTDTFSPESAKMLMMQEYDRATGNARNKQTSRKY